MKPPSRLWYLLALTPLPIMVAVIVVTVVGALRDVEAMPRAVMPGELRTHLTAGEHVIFGEMQSRVNGEVFVTSSLSLRCAATDAAGADIALESPTMKSTYMQGTYSGESMFEITAPVAGEYVIRCDGDRGVIAVGEGVGGMLGMLLATFFGGPLLSLVIAALVWRARNKAIKRLAATQPPIR